MTAMPTLPGFVTGAVPTASNMNALSAGVDALSRITIGKAASLEPADRPVLKVVRLQNLTLTTGALTFVVWEQAMLNTDDMWVNPLGAQCVINTPGWYRVAAGVSYDPGAPSLRICRVFVNGTADPANGVSDSDVVMGTGIGANSCRTQVQSFEHLDVGATLQLGVFQNSGANVVLDPIAKWGTWMLIRWEAPY